MMDLAQKTALTAAMTFFVVALLGGVWKYAAIRRSPKAEAPAYVDIFHRASLLYAFACLLLERMVEVSQLPTWVELSALAAAIFFFAFAVFGYALHGWLNYTDNQLRRPYRLGSGTLPPWVVHGSMVALVIGEIGGTLVLMYGVIQAY